MLVPSSCFTFNCIDYIVALGVYDTFWSYTDIVGEPV